MISGLKRHALVMLIAVLVATYQLYRLELQRTRRTADIDDEFERAARFLQSHLRAGKYEVRVTVAFSQTSQHKSALVINRQYDIPRIEAELFVDPRLVTKRKQHKSSSIKPRTARPATSVSGRSGGAADALPSTLRLRIYDHATMDAVAQALQQKKLIESFDAS